MNDLTINEINARDAFLARVRRAITSAEAITRLTTDKTVQGLASNAVNDLQELADDLQGL